MLCARSTLDRANKRRGVPRDVAGDVMLVRYGRQVAASHAKADPVIEVKADRAEGRWFLLTLLIDPDTQKPAWSMATLEYEYERKSEGWKFVRNRCIHEHILAPYDKGWGPDCVSKLSDATETMPNHHFEKLNAQGGKQRPGKTSRSIRGWTVPTLEPE